MRLFCFIVFSTLIACSSGGKVTPAPGVSREQACEQLAKAICDQYAKCSPLELTSKFGDLTTCLVRTKASCPVTFDLPSSSATPDRMAQCATELAQMACEERAIKTPPSCVPAPGGLAEGANCHDDAQCKSTWCAKNDDALCGTCTVPLNLGNFCLDVGERNDGTRQQTCGRDLVCMADGYSKELGPCLRPAALGESCSSPCAAGLACIDGKCSQPRALGEPCGKDGYGRDCDVYHNQWCNETTRVCTLFIAAGAGEACGYVGDDYAVCSGGARCIMKDSSYTGRCVTPAADGAACNPKEGPDCLAPAKCVGSVCTLPTPSSCR